MDPFGWFATGCTCAACDSKFAGITCETVEGIAALGLALKVQRETLGLKADDYSASEGEDGQLPSDAEEATIVALLMSAVMNVGQSFIDELKEVLNKFGFAVNKILDLVTKYEPKMSNVFDSVKDEVTDAIDSTISVGESQVVADALEGMMERQRILDGIVSATKYYTNNYFNTKIVPAIQARIDEFLTNPVDPLKEPDFHQIKELVDARFKNVPYWRVVANAGASRGYHYGFLKAAATKSLTGYRLVAVIDRRTSAICLELNGKEFKIADAIARMEQAINSDDPQAQKDAMPWVKASDIEGLSSAQLTALGVLVPPFHGNCRTTLVVF